MRKSIDEIVKNMNPSKLVNPAGYLFLRAVEVFRYVENMHPEKYSAGELLAILKRWVTKEKVPYHPESLAVYDVFKILIPKHRKYSQYNADEKKLFDALVTAPFCQSLQNGI